MASVNIQKGSRAAAGMTHTLCCSVRATSWDSFTFQVAGMMTSTCRGTKHGIPSQELIHNTSATSQNCTHTCTSEGTSRPQAGVRCGA